MGLICVAVPPPGLASGSACPADRFDAEAVVGGVFDGDTLALSNRTKIRLSGINTPETGHEDRPSEPFAEAARDHLRRLAPPGTDIRLRYDTQRHDRYGRVLAHVFLKDGSNVQESLLDAGLATALVVPPNAWRHPCYAEIEARARGARRGIWALERYRQTAAENLGADSRGFRIVAGRVQRVGEGRKNIWLNLAPKVAVRIPKPDLVYFDGYRPEALIGRRVEARGWIQRRKGELRITVRHPAALLVLD
jgi:endonuclease YncB( thermonuclease family)